MWIDWRLTPALLESRDEFFTRLVEQTEHMVAACMGEPAVVVGFSLGCRIAKYFLHFCQAHKGGQWVAEHLAHFVPLGGPFLGAVQLLKAVMVDGSFAPLDMLFTESEMLTILRSVPVGRYLQPVGDWKDGLDMPFVYVRDEIYVGVAIGPMTLSAIEEAHTVHVMQASRVGICRQPPEFHAEHPFVEKVTFTLSPEVSCADFDILVRSRKSKLLATGVLHADWEHMDCSQPIVVELSKARKLDANAGIEWSDEEQLGSIQVRLSVLTSREMSSRNRWKATLQCSLLDRMLRRLSIWMVLRCWNRRASCVVKESSESGHSAEIPTSVCIDVTDAQKHGARTNEDWFRGLEFEEDDVSRSSLRNEARTAHGSVEHVSNAIQDENPRAVHPLGQHIDRLLQRLLVWTMLTRWTSRTLDEQAINIEERVERGQLLVEEALADPAMSTRAKMKLKVLLALKPRIEGCNQSVSRMAKRISDPELGANSSTLHPLEQHMGNQEASLHASNLFSACSSDATSLNWTAAHPLALQGYEGLHVMPSSTWGVPDNSLHKWADDSSVPPPVAKVTAIYGVNSRTVRTIFLKHREVHVTGGKVEKLQAALVLDFEADIDGLLCYDGQGFETGAVQQVQQDTGNQVFLSGDGTVNYQSLRHAATWKDSCEVEVYELPGCDHRGVSMDSRMLKLLRQVLGLAERDQTLTGKIHEKASEAAGRYDGIVDYSSSSVVCGLIGKLGMRSLDVFRDRFGLLVKVAAVLSFLICVLVVSFGASEDYSIITNLSWATAGLAFNDTSLADIARAQNVRVDLGVLSYSYGGLTQSASKARYGEAFTCSQVVNLQLYEYDTSCSSLTQNITGWLGCYGIFNFCADQEWKVPCGVLKFRDRFQLSYFLDTEVGRLDQTGGISMGTWARLIMYGDSECIRTTGMTDCGQIDSQCGSDTGHPVVDHGGHMKVCQPTSATISGTEYKFSYRVTPAFRYTPPGSINVAGTVGVNRNVFINLYESGAPFNDGIGCKSITCSEDQSTALLQTFDSTCTQLTSSQTVSAPIAVSSYPNIFNPTGLAQMYSCTEFPDYFLTQCHSTQTNLESKCTLTYQECKDQYDTSEQMLEIPGKPGCHKGLMHDMCVDCYQAGVRTYIFMCCTCAVQIPLVWLNIRRTSPAMDGRIFKFMSAVLAALVIVGSILVFTTWKTDCYDKMAEYISDAPIYYNWYTFATDYLSLNWAAFAPLISGSLALVVAVVNLITPVPEIFQSACIDPLEIVPKQNSHTDLQLGSEVNPEDKNRVTWV